ncbi:unnamed protein product [Caenorhabditis angaria]|uniref:Peptidase M13 C-terminal domain-containing protein n=1 Tax=Caenorhabditis angaria TaxID=860376 RepID=A0A9P1J3V9_9PELO|nr:unnamed protein product [Caenorhabditis angaria]
MMPPYLSLLKQDMPLSLQQPVNDSQIEENTSDIIGIPLAYKVLKNKFTQGFYSRIRGHKSCWSHAKLFFYAYSNICCYREDQEPEQHQTPQVRINSVFAQIPDFGRIFKCDKDSRMMKAQTEQCHVLGKDAPKA